MAAIDSGIEPDKELEAKDTFWRDNKSPIEVGISPSSPFDERFKNRSGVDSDAGDSQIGEILQPTKPNSGESLEAVDASEGSKI
ncbi:hypothetical protein U1Q18_020258 [Sarracenia purpurea var. burkii]